MITLQGSRFMITRCGWWTETPTAPGTGGCGADGQKAAEAGADRRRAHQRAAPGPAREDRARGGGRDGQHTDRRRAGLLGADGAALAGPVRPPWGAGHLRPAS